ncbi:LacI family DNA-binding transcriptional regulator [Microbacterium oleivorans]|uniref:LacI family transcriptional regulator n=1 Tax=Microbacterium oleivorans TaxID=273677 RepID=A0A4R5YJY3_9MICO|nr:LacI family DNA-binding transcriptional regulator [Microbacterium oleivorans]TDL45238.1 LacI family transcriptional regulator [Microbacterium oleivorans]
MAVRNTKPATIYDVAEAAGVSHQTVSRYLAGYEGIRPTTRERVERAIYQLEYRPNLSARGLKLGRSHIIAALTHELGQVGPARVAEGAAAAAREAGYVLDLITLDVYNPQAIEESLRLLNQQTLAGVLALSSTDEMNRVFAGADFAVPLHVHSEPDDASGAYDTGLATLIAHLAALGHRRIVHIAGAANWPASRNRSRAVAASAAANGVEVVAELRGDWSAASAHAAVAALERLPSASAFVASNDQMALGVMLALKERGLRVPEDVSVAGVDDIPEAAFFDPPLTTLRVDFAARGRQIVADMLARIGTPPPSTPAVDKPALQVRRSTAPPPD